MYKSEYVICEWPLINIIHLSLIYIGTQVTECGGVLVSFHYVLVIINHFIDHGVNHILPADSCTLHQRRRSGQSCPGGE